jgi:hypothetical protein
LEDNSETQHILIRNITLSERLQEMNTPQNALLKRLDDVYEALPVRVGCD